MLAGGSEAPITFGMIRSWESVRVLATGNGDPSRACRPFSADREGLVMGEGAAMLLLEELEHAQQRGSQDLCGNRRFRPEFRRRPHHPALG